LSSLNVLGARSVSSGSQAFTGQNIITSLDEKLGFEAAVAALGIYHVVSLQQVLQYLRDIVIVCQWH